MGVLLLFGFVLLILYRYGQDNNTAGQWSTSAGLKASSVVAYSLCVCHHSLSDGSSWVDTSLLGYDAQQRVVSWNGSLFVTYDSLQRIAHISLYHDTSGYAGKELQISYLQGNALLPVLTVVQVAVRTEKSWKWYIQHIPKPSNRILWVDLLPQSPDLFVYTLPEQPNHSFMPAVNLNTGEVYWQTLLLNYDSVAYLWHAGQRQLSVLHKFSDKYYWEGVWHQFVYDSLGNIIQSQHKDTLLSPYALRNEPLQTTTYLYKYDAQQRPTHLYMLRTDGTWYQKDCHYVSLSSD